MTNPEISYTYYKENFLRGRVNLAKKLQTVTDSFSSIPISESKQFLHSSALLVLAGFKPGTFYSLPNTNDQKTNEIINKLNSISFRRFKIFHFDSKFIVKRKGCSHKERQIYMVNLQALYNKVNSSTIKDIPKLKSTKFEDFINWYKNICEKFMGDKSTWGNDGQTMLNGFIHGYPDRAILDYMEARKSNTTNNLVPAIIPRVLHSETDIFTANFYLFKESLANLDVKRYLERAGNLLERLVKRTEIVDYK
jgi:hypothetical protein